MKLFGVVILAGYFLAREREPYGRNSLADLIRSWAVYVTSAGFTFFSGFILNGGAGGFYLFILLLAAALPVIIFRGSVVCMLSGAATAFCVLRLLPDFGKAAVTLLAAETAVLIVVFLYRGTRQRMTHFHVPALAQNSIGRLLLLFSLAVLLAAVYQKSIQLFQV